MAMGLFSCAVLAHMAALASAACSPAPIVMRIGNVSLSNNMTARGVAMSVGEPPQSLALLPLWSVRLLAVHVRPGADRPRS